MIVVWIFAVVGVVFTVLCVWGWCIGPGNESERPARRRTVSGEVARPTARREDDDERARTEYRAVTAQYRALIDELYNYGENVARRRADRR